MHDVPGHRLFQGSDHKQYDNVLQSSERKALQRTGSCKGAKTWEDSYVGAIRQIMSPLAEKKSCSGNRTFAGCGNKIKVSCKIEAENGTAKIIFQSGMEDARILCDGTGEHTETIELPPASNYLKIEGKDFTGTIELDSE